MSKGEPMYAVSAQHPQKRQGITYSNIAVQTRLFFFFFFSKSFQMLPTIYFSSTVFTSVRFILGQNCRPFNFVV
jgi:hypothetical protein